MNRLLPVAGLILLGGVILTVTVRRQTLNSQAGLDSSASDSTVLHEPATRSASLPFKYENRRPERSGEVDLQNRAAIEREFEQEASAAHEAIAARYSSEPVDAKWAANSESKLLSASKSAQISDMRADPVALVMDCKTSTCRVQADFDSMTQAQDWLTLFTLNLGEALPETSFKYTAIPGGGARATLYGVANR